jgi:leucyl/phenylalanyl-tRNA---protein transferase
MITSMIEWLSDNAPFPPTHLALGPASDAAGLLAAGGSLSPQRLHTAYRQGIFPWFGPGQPIMWWSPDPRMVLPINRFKFKRSLRKSIQRLLREERLEIRIDHDFRQVMLSCANAPRDGQAGTWIVPEMQNAYGQWHFMSAPNEPMMSRPHSFETWIDGELAGGLYGVNIGRMFFGESMFAHCTDASKMALAALVCFCMHNAIDVIDCQQQTEHLASLGAEPWPRARFEAHLAGTVDLVPPATWVYDEAMWQALFMR